MFHFSPPENGDDMQIISYFYGAGGIFSGKTIPVPTGESRF
jgi:hypothetical protein